jgi:hypothetical protein
VGGADSRFSDGGYRKIVFGEIDRLKPIALLMSD